jgi:hypothetical protein
MKVKKNGKVINLTESDLRRIVKKVIKEQDEAPVSGGTEGGKTSWRFTVKSSPRYKNSKGTKGGFTSEVLISKVEKKDPKTGKKGQPYYSVSTKKEGGQVVFVGKIGIGTNGVNFTRRGVLMKNVGAYASDSVPEPSVATALAKGFKDTIGLDINFQLPK